MDPVSDLRLLINGWRAKFNLGTVDTVLYLAMAIGWYAEAAYPDRKTEKKDRGQ